MRVLKSEILRKLQQIDEANFFLQHGAHRDNRGVELDENEVVLDVRELLWRNLEELWKYHIPIHYDEKEQKSYIVDEECGDVLISTIEEEELACLNTLTQEWNQMKPSRKRDNLAQAIQDQIERMQAMGMKLEQNLWVHRYYLEGMEEL